MGNAEDAGWQLALAVAELARGLEAARKIDDSRPNVGWPDVCEWAELVVATHGFEGVRVRWVSDDEREEGWFEDATGERVGWLRLDRGVDPHRLEWGPRDRAFARPPGWVDPRVAVRPAGEERSFADYVYDEIVKALGAIDARLTGDVYVVSLLMYDEDDDPRFPTVTVGFNTEARVREQTPLASDAAEARWNFAFWLQNDLKVVADSQRDSRGAGLRREWVESLGLWYSDEHEQKDWGAIEPLAASITENFVALVVRVVQRLHESGVIERVFGRPIPVLIHELEYYDEIATQNDDANPPGTADEFVRWVMGPD